MMARVRLYAMRLNNPGCAQMIARTCTRVSKGAAIILGTYNRFDTTRQLSIALRLRVTRSADDDNDNKMSHLVVLVAVVKPSKPPGRRACFPPVLFQVTRGKMRKWPARDERLLYIVPRRLTAAGKWHPA